MRLAPASFLVYLVYLVEPQLFINHYETLCVMKKLSTVVELQGFNNIQYLGDKSYLKLTFTILTIVMKKRKISIFSHRNFVVTTASNFTV